MAAQLGYTFAPPEVNTPSGLKDMKLTWQDIKTIVELYEHFEEEMDRKYLEWQMDEDQTGIPNPFEVSKEDICKDVLIAFDRGKK